MTTVSHLGCLVSHPYHPILIEQPSESKSKVQEEAHLAQNAKVDCHTPVCYHPALILITVILDELEKTDRICSQLKQGKRYQRVEVVDGIRR